MKYKTYFLLFDIWFSRFLFFFLIFLNRFLHIFSKTIIDSKIMIVLLLVVLVWFRRYFNCWFVENEFAVLVLAGIKLVSEKHAWMIGLRLLIQLESKNGSIFELIRRQFFKHFFRRKISLRCYQPRNREVSLHIFHHIWILFWQIHPIVYIFWKRLFIKLRKVFSILICALVWILDFLGSINSLVQYIYPSF